VADLDPLAAIAEFCAIRDARLVYLSDVRRRLKALSSRPVTDETDALERSILWRQLDVLIWIKEAKERNNARAERQ
jgi:hypothetical protein